MRALRDIYKIMKRIKLLRESEEFLGRNGWIVARGLYLTGNIRQTINLKESFLEDWPQRDNSSFEEKMDKEIIQSLQELAGLRKKQSDIKREIKQLQSQIRLILTTLSGTSSEHLTDEEVIERLGQVIQRTHDAIIFDQTSFNEFIEAHNSSLGGK